MLRKGLTVCIIVFFICICIIPTSGNQLIRSKSNLELIIEGPTLGVIGEVMSYTLLLNISEEDQIFCKWSWGDGTDTGWMGPYLYGEGCDASHSWNECGTYTIRAGVICDNGTYWAELEIKIFDTLPKLIIDGPTWGKVGVTYNYTIILYDREGELFYFFIDYGDGTNTGWFGPFSSNEEMRFRRSWDKKGIYVLSVKAKDIYDRTYSVSLEVTIPKNNRFNNIHFNWKFENFPLMHRILHILWCQIE